VACAVQQDSGVAATDPGHKTVWIPLTENCRRDSHRWPLNARVTLLEPMPAEGVGLNASQSGARIAMNCSLRAQERVVMCVTFDSGYQRVLAGRVVWTRPTNDGTIAGVELQRQLDA
jgi:hypothetical protein